MLSHLHESGQCCSAGTVQGCLLAKIDIESAFCNIHSHPEERHLLGTMWNEKLKTLTLCCLLGSALHPIKVFNSVADALQWIAKQYVISYLEHFLDDFITAGPPLNDCKHKLSLLEKLFSLLGLSLGCREARRACYSPHFFRDRA